MIKRLVLVCVLVVTTGSVSVAAQTTAPPSFEHPPFVNPRVVTELAGWISDSGEVVVGINLDRAQDSNEFFLADAPAPDTDVETRWQTVNTSTAPPTVCVLQNVDKKFGGGQEHDCYRYIGRSKEGLIALSVSSYADDGTGRFESLLVLEEKQDHNIDGQARHLLISRGGITIGDRVPVDKIELTGNRVTMTFDDRPPKTYDLPPAEH